ncbi:tetratricopeptide repeat protein [Micromonospora sp. NPDC048835]|uniref:tetratricopeptide repeat protein n=1 Tax=Micromonospora sp. NPDC048835 TaxID=3155147 RepID=UPI0033D19016
MIRLTVSATDVVLAVRDDRWRHPVGPADQRTADLLWRLRGGPSVELSYEVGVALGRRFLHTPGPALRVELARPGRHRLGIEVTDPALADLPWETLVLPGEELPLALHPDVDVCRVGPDRPVPAVRVDGPLRMLAAIASPEDSTQQLLDHERELGRILGAVEPGHRHGVRVRVLEWGSADAIRAALTEEPFHVLHVSSHARPGALLLETPSGAEDRVDAARFLAEVLPPGRTVPLIVLAGCSTARPDHRELPGLAGALLAHGAPAVLAMNGTVSDGYTIEFCARLYERLAARSEPELLAEVSAVRRELAPTAAEWWMPTLFLADPGLRLAGGRGGTAEAAPAGQSVVADGVVRAPTDFVGRREILRRLSRGKLRVLVHGIGGIGKTSLAAEFAQRFRDRGGIVVATHGDATVDAVLDELRRQVRRRCDGSAPDDPLRRCLAALAEPGHDWRRRLAALDTGGTPLLLVLDNAEDALDAEHRLADADLAAFLAAWASRHELVVTSRHPFPVAGLETCHLGPLSWQETRKLLWRLPGVGQLAPAEQQRMWHRLGGHPRALEYLDGLLREGSARSDEVASRLTAAGGGRDGATAGAGTPLAEAGALVAEDVLLPRLLARLEAAPAARRLLLGAAVYRTPADRTGLAWQLADAADGDTPPPEPAGLDEAVETLSRLGLLAPVTGGHLVHRWTAASLLRIAGREAVAESHRRAGRYWGWRARSSTDQHDFIRRAVEARYHHLAAGDTDEVVTYSELACQELHAAGHWAWEEKLWRELLPMVPHRSARAASFLKGLGDVHLSRGEYPQATERYQAALTIYRDLGDDSGVGKLLHQLGLVADNRGDRTTADRLYQEALTILSRLDDRAAVGKTLHQLAGIARGNGDAELAMSRYLEELEIVRDLDDLDGIAASHHQIGVLAFEARDLVKAEQCIQVAITTYGRMGARVQQGSGLVMLGRIALARFAYEAAESRVRAALKIFEEVGSNGHVAECTLLLGHLSRDLDDLEFAESCFARARTIVAALGEAPLLRRCDELLGGVRTVLGRAAEAVPHTLGAIDGDDRPPHQPALEWLAVQRLELGRPAFTDLVARHLDPRRAAQRAEWVEAYLRFRFDVSHPTPLGSAYVLLAIAAARSGEFGTARMCLLRALPICAAAGYRAGVAKCHEDLGMVALETRRLAEARSRYEQALEVYRVLRHEPNQAIVLHQLGRVCEEQEDFAGADGFYRRSIAIKKRLGNQSGVSNSTFHLGRVAALRGDRALAERCYRTCLRIDSEQGNWEAVALDQVAIGQLRVEQGHPAEGVPLIVEALAIDRRIGSANAALDLNALRDLRAGLGDEAFRAILTDAFGPARADEVLDLIAVLPTVAQPTSGLG